MYRIITDNEQINRAQKIFKDALLGVTTKEYHRCKFRIWDFTVYWIEHLGICVSFEEEENRYWNAFGTTKPKCDGDYFEITCEINFPYEGINRRIAGAFAEDDEGSVYAIHRGKIGGGRERIGKKFFEDNYRGEWITLSDGDEVALIGKIGDNELPSRVAKFVKEVERIKYA